MKYLPFVISTTGHVFTVVRLTLCTICLTHKNTGQEYVVIFTDSNKIRDYKTGFVLSLGEIKQNDLDLILDVCKK